jgi:RNA polymerase sigma factor FliA
MERNMKKTQKQRDKIVLDHMPLVNKIANQMLTKQPSSVTYDDLYGPGIEGLIDGAEKYESSKENKISTYLTYRIKGAMLDYLRSKSTKSRYQLDFERSKRRVIESYRLENDNQMPPDTAIATLMNIPLEEFQRKSAITHNSLEFSINTPLGNTLESDGSTLENTITYKNEVVMEDYLESKLFRQIFLTSYDKLPVDQKIILDIIYKEGLSLSELAEVLSVTPQAVCSEHGKALESLEEIVTEDALNYKW